VKLGYRPAGNRIFNRLGGDGAGGGRIFRVLIQSCRNPRTGATWPIISDGGFKFYGDMAKANRVPALDVVMIGSRFVRPVKTNKTHPASNSLPGPQFQMFGWFRKNRRDARRLARLPRYAQETMTEAILKLSRRDPKAPAFLIGHAGEMVTTNLCACPAFGMGYPGCHDIKEFSRETRSCACAAVLD